MTTDTGRICCGPGYASPAEAMKAPRVGDCTFDVGVESHDKLYRNPFQSPLRPDELKPGLQRELASVPDAS